MNAATRTAVSSLAAIALVFAAAPPARAQDVDRCIAASEKAVSLRKAGKLIESRAALSTCAVLACPDPVRSSCEQRLTAANKAVPSLVFQVTDGAGRDLPTWTVTRDGQPLGELAVGRAIELDPGEHTFVFEAEGYAPTRKTLVVVEGVRDRRETVMMGGGASDAAPSQGGGNTQRTIGLIIGGVGIAGIA